MNTQIKTIFTLAGLIMLMAVSANAQRGQGDLTGMAQRAELPELVTISGVLDYIKTGPCESATGHAYIGTHLFLQSGVDETLWNIHLGAAYAVEDYINKLQPGDNVEVIGFRTDLMEADNYVAKEISVNGRVFELRDENLRPFWAGDRSQNYRGRRIERRRDWRW